MNRHLPWITLTLLLGAPVVHSSDDDARYQVIADLGRLNGIALHCKYLDQVRNMKEAVVENAPKQRSYGIKFDEATNDGFLAMIQSAQPCPGPAGFSEQVKAAVSELQRIFRQD